MNQIRQHSLLNLANGISKVLPVGRGISEKPLFETIITGQTVPVRVKLPDSLTIAWISAPIVAAFAAKGENPVTAVTHANEYIIEMMKQFNQKKEK